MEKEFIIRSYGYGELAQLYFPNVTKKSYPTERECAIAVDLYFISIGKKPLNILKAK